MPAIVDPDGPGGQSISIFESGAILQYLARKTGLFYGNNEHDRIAVEQWLMWQIGGIGPMAGQAHHFLKYAPSMEPPHVLPYAQDRYRNETGRLYRVLDRQLANNRYVAGDFYSIADMAIWCWASLWKGQQQSIDDKPNMARWLDEVKSRAAVRKGRDVGAELRDRKQSADEKQAANKILFGQTGLRHAR